MSEVSARVFQDAAPGAFKELGLVPDAETAIFKEADPMLRWAAQDTTGMADLYVDYESSFDENAAEAFISKTPVGGPFHLRGMFRTLFGRVPITAYSGWSRRTYHFKVRAEVYPSPQAINVALATLGRTPGTDAFKLVRSPGIGDFPAAAWMKGFANMIVPVADMVNPTYSQHDTDPVQHVQSWIATPPYVCRTIAARAAQLLETHGDAVSADDDERPVEVNQFVRAIDGLEDITDPLFQGVWLVSNSEVPVERALGHLGQLVADESIAGGSWNFRRLGVIQDGLEREARLKEAVFIRAEFIAHVAHMLLNLEDVRPLERQSAGQRSERLRALRQIAIPEKVLALAA